MAKKLKVTLIKSLIGLSPKQEATVRALGLKHIRQTVEHDDTPTIRGMIGAVPFAVKVADEGETTVAGRDAAEGETSVAGRDTAEGETRVSRKAP